MPKMTFSVGRNWRQYQLASGNLRAVCCLGSVMADPAEWLTRSRLFRRNIPLFIRRTCSLLPPIEANATVASMEERGQHRRGAKRLKRPNSANYKGVAEPPKTACEIIKGYKLALARAKGEKYAAETEVHYENGWFTVHHVDGTRSKWRRFQLRYLIDQLIESDFDPQAYEAAIQAREKSRFESAQHVMQSQRSVSTATVPIVETTQNGNSLRIVGFWLFLIAVACAVTGWVVWIDLEKEERFVNDAKSISLPQRQSSIDNTTGADLTIPVQGDEREALKEFLIQHSETPNVESIAQSAVLNRMLTAKEATRDARHRSAEFRSWMRTRFSTEDLQLYDFMKFLWESFSSGGRYLPEVHDPIVLKAASDRFGISRDRAQRKYLAIDSYYVFGQKGMP